MQCVGFWCGAGGGDSHIKKTGVLVALVSLRVFSLERPCIVAGAAGPKLMSEVVRDESTSVRGHTCTRALNSSLCSLMMPTMRAFLQAAEYLTTSSSCYFCVPAIHVLSLLVGLSCRTERFSVMPIPHKKPTNGLKFFSGNW